MNNRKSLFDISWQVSEEVYRKDPAYSYSRASRLLNEGPMGLIKPQDKKTDSLTFGSLVDCILTDAENFNERFFVADTHKTSDFIKKTVGLIYENYGQIFDSLEEVGEDMLPYIELEDWQSNWGPAAKIRNVIKDGSDYYKLLKYSEGKEIVTKAEAEAAKATVIALKEHMFTSGIFDIDEENEELLYQLKFKSDIKGIPVKIMLDIVKVNHLYKTIIPMDLKTTGKPEYKFNKSYFEWNYWIQSPLYSTVLKDNLLKDDFFRDYELLPFRFVVINKVNLSPMIWVDDDPDGIADKIIETHNTTWQDLFQDMHWYYENQLFSYDRKTYENGGTKSININ